MLIKKQSCPKGKHSVVGLPKGKHSVVVLPKRGTGRNRKEVVILFKWISNEGLE